MQVLVLGCEISEVNELCRWLEEIGLESEAVSDPQAGCGHLLSEPYDVALIDLKASVPAGLSSLSFLARSNCATPIICLLAEDASVATRIACLDAGADDVISRPFEYGELRARIAAAHRRTTAPAERQTVRFADIALEMSRHDIHRNGRKISLTPLEHRLLAYFIRHPHRIITPEILAEQVWEQQYISSNTLRVRIHSLKTKINAPGERNLIRAVKDTGYILD